MSIADRVKRVEENIANACIKAGRNPDQVSLVAASKTQNHLAIQEAIQAGVKICGENRVQEMQANLAHNAYDGARIDFIGTLQRNKVKQVVGTASLIHSVTSEKLLEEISKSANHLQISQDILLEINLGQESSKSGFIIEEIDEICHKCVETSGINLKGFMAIPPPSTDKRETEKFFERLFHLYIDFSAKMSHNYKEFHCLSMGMSQDYEMAIAHGSTLVRVGTALFGQRKI